MNPVFVTGNGDKAKYLSRLIGVPIRHQKIDLDEIQTTDMKKLTEDKARRAYEVCHEPVIVEDVGLYFDAFGDLPGPFIKFFVDQDDGLEKLCRMLDSFSNRRARTVVQTTYYDGDKFVHFEGGATGEIANRPRGDGGFGYDKIWCVDGYDGRTRAELSPDEDDRSYLAARPIEEMRVFFKSLKNNTSK